MKKAVFVVAIVSAVLFLLSVTAFAQDIQGVTVTATEDGLELPLELTAGIVTLSFDNQSEAPILPVPSRLLDDVTQEVFLTTLESEGQLAALGLIAMQGGTMIFPGVQYDVTYDFDAGEYALINFAAEVPQISWFTVVENDSDVEQVTPEAEVVVQLMDFAFSIPAEIETGAKLWHIQNIGGQWHEMIFIPVEEGTTVEEAQAMMLPAPVEGETEEPASDSNEDHGEDEAPEEAPFTFMWIPMEAGEQAWMTVDLAPGTYAVGCMLPNLEEMGGEEEPHMHSDLGMVRIITVK